MPRYVCLVALLLAMSSFAVNSPQAEAAELLAGAAKVKITPWLGVSINGGMSDRIANEIHDDLHARALVLDDGRTRLAIVVCDACMIPREVFDAAKAAAERETGIPAAHMLMSATHTHSAPTSTGVFQSDADPRYAALLTERIAAAVVAAAKARQPARLGWGVGQAPEHVFNRRWKLAEGKMPPGPFGHNHDRVKMNPGAGSPDLIEPAGPTDPAVTVLSVERADGRPLALFANYSLHYVGGVPGGDISADYFGAFCSKIERELSTDGAEVVALLSNGTSGDINNVNFRTPAPRRAPYEQIEHVSGAVAAEALRVRAKIEHRADATLAAAQTTLQLGVRKADAKELDRAREILAAADSPQLRGLDQIYARETVLLGEYPDQVEALVQAVRIGEGGLAAIPCETFVEIGLALRGKAPLRPFCTVSLANGYNGYLPTPEHHALGGYETWRARSSYLEVEAAPKIVAALTDLFGQVAPASK